MLIGGIAFGLVLGLLAGGRLTHLATIRLRWVPLIFGALAMRFAIDFLLRAGEPVVETLRMPLLAAAFALLLAGLWANRSFPGIGLAFVGVLSNAVVITVNGGYMPIWEPSLVVAGFDPGAISSALHVVLRTPLDADFLIRLGPLSDVIPIPFPLVQNVASIGDVFLSTGLAFLLFAGLMRPYGLDDQGVAAIRQRIAAVAGTGLTPALDAAVALDRPLLLGGAGAGLASPASVALPRPVPPIAERIRAHPYVRLALNGSFSSLWAGQLISLFGDRVHQVALAAVVLITTGSALATGLVFMVATLPNVLFSPIAGTLVDRWDHKEVLVVSDLLRASVILLIPIAVSIDIILVYPLVFLVTSISIFFRPARVAILPRVVKEDELLTANSALWVAETLADVVGYPLAAVFVASLGQSLPLAFWIDAVTYVGSAALLATIAVPARQREPANADAVATPTASGLLSEMREGWQFLRREPTLLANTAQATVAQFATGILIGLAVVYAERVFDGAWGFSFEAIYGFLETGIGVGSLIGGFVVGLIGARFAKGRLIIVGYTLMGVCMAVLGLTDELAIALAVMFGAGVANMVYVIPSQTLFQERTPSEMMGRVIGFRFALVFGAMTVAMGTGGILAEFLPVGAVIGTFGLLTAGAGLIGLFVPAIRDA